MCLRAYNLDTRIREEGKRVETRVNRGSICTIYCFRVKALQIETWFCRNYPFQYLTMKSVYLSANQIHVLLF